MDIDADLKESGADGKYPAKPKTPKGSLRIHAKEPKAPVSLGKLHDLLTRGLPTYCDNGALNVRRIATDLGISWQAVYGWFRRERIAARRARQFVLISQSTPLNQRPRPVFVNGDEVKWTPLHIDDFWEFMD